MENEKQVINKHINERSDSFEIGTPSKGGAIKVYFNVQNPDEAKKLISEAMQIRKFAEEEYEKSKVSE